ITRAGDGLTCLSNVCTHRAMCVVERPSAARGLLCRYHGRRFGLDGAFASAPGFEGALDFPRAADSLARYPLERRGPFLFAALDPDVPFEDWWAPVAARCGHLPWEALERDRSRDRAFRFDAHWALYVENYLEGLHIPYIHPGLVKTLDWQHYRYELFGHSNLQLGVAADGDLAFDSPPFDVLPDGHPDRGQRVAAWYWWLFPNLMLNVYPWGISVNVVEPLGPARTEVRFQAYVWDRSKLDAGAGGDLVGVEYEDEAAVVSVQRGLASRAYTRGRYAPEHEVATHQFHRLLAARLGD
ncbi:MAG: SRPBCC family protein, partial [Planctomycetota bacterium]